MMRSTFVKDVFTKGEFPTVNQDDPLSRCIELFKTHIEMPPALAVLNNKGQYVGVIARRWVNRSRLDPSAMTVKALARPAPKVDPDVSLSKAANLMIHSGVRQLPVYQKNKLIGIVTDENIIDGAITQTWGNTKINDIMTKAPDVIEANRSIGAVLSLLREKGISHVPVMNEGKLVGIISLHDIIEQIYYPRKRPTVGDIKGDNTPTLNVPAKGIMASPVITVNPDTTLRDATKKMHDHNISCLPVIDANMLIGIVTKLDFLELISQMETADRKFTVQFGVKDVEVNPDEQAFMMAEFDSLVRRYQDIFQMGTLFVYLKTHGANHRGIPLLHCRLQLRTVKGQFYSSSEGFGVEPTFRVALDRLDKRILRSKELKHDPTFARDYLRKVGIPFGEAT
ncbi:MAG TPA: CBS domain-containing protein [Candidatus Sulfotelmatobacter sp.]|nr:CBS domain-containing protein [Candidatus Sulfotelmatobacter sp.]